MRLTLDSLAILDAIDRRGSFAAAAEELHRVPSAVTYSISKLEGDLDVALFDRSGHRAELTQAGHELLREGRHLLRAAASLEGRVKRVATGWEAELRIVIGDLVNQKSVFELAQEFYQKDSGTRLRIVEEVYGGTWDALASDRADLIIGAPPGGPSGGGYATRPMSEMEFVFVVTPEHPLATMPEPLKSFDILQYRSVTAADSSRNLPPRTSGLLSGQEALTVPDMVSKYMAQRMGLGVGFLPKSWVAKDVAAGRFIIKAVEDSKGDAMGVFAWRTEHTGRALSWFLKKLGDPKVLVTMLAPPDLIIGK
ncbi:MAG: LysR family transcriptional regulator [Acidiferrobacterales bacterium]